MTRLFRTPHPQTGFTLLEMVIVLTAIGLIAGSIVVIRDMVRNAEVQSVINDEDRYKKAIALFKEKYNYLPGDMPAAEGFWGSDVGCPNTGYSAAEAAPKTATCNGDGNGRIDTFAEGIRAWQQLADAGFIQGGFSGIQGNSTNANSIAIGIDVPASKVPGCGWIVGYMPVFYSANFGGRPATTQAGTYLALVAGGLDLQYPPCLSPSESYSIDTKIDDGIPSSGNMIGGTLPILVDWYTPPFSFDNGTLAKHKNVWPCTPTANPWQYNTAASGIYCNPFFNTGL